MQQQVVHGQDYELEANRVVGHIQTASEHHTHWGIVPTRSCDRKTTIDQRSFK
ncbi:MAG TPA: hypothetical protein VME46_14835 [Acidimicrobiales bacterium]|nr:hypothetical protein [Acidimicrobiales bacterium]